MIKYFKHYLVSLAALLAIDMLWLGLVALMNFTRRDIAYTAVIL